MCLFTCIDHLVTRSCLLVLVYSCTWFCGDDKVCILQTQPGGSNDVAALLVHGDMFFVCLFFRLYFFDTKAAGLMLSRLQMSAGLFRDGMIEKKKQRKLR